MLAPSASKGEEKSLSYSQVLPDYIDAPILKGQKIRRNSDL